MRDGMITVIAIAIGDTIRDEWLNKLQPMRPNRDLEAELKQQDAALNNMDFDAIFFPTWRRTIDNKNYVNLYRTIIESKRRSVETSTSDR